MAKKYVYLFKEAHGLGKEVYIFFCHLKTSNIGSCLTTRYYYNSFLCRIKVSHHKKSKYFLEEMQCFSYIIVNILVYI